MLRVLAMKDAQDHLSLVVVNDNTDPVTFLLKVDGMDHINELYQYQYFENNMPTDEKGFPVIHETMTNLNLREGLQMEMPGEGVLFFTTIAE